MARGATPGPHPELPSHVRRRLEVAAKRLRVLGSSTIVITTDDPRCGSANEILGWAETASVSASRQPIAPTHPQQDESAFELSNVGWIEALWQLRSSPEVTAAANDRRFWMRLAESSQGLLPCSRLVDSIEALRASLKEVISHSAQSAWIAKAPFSASGRERVYRWGADFSPDIETRLERLFARYGELILEPLMKRVLDVGVAGIVGNSGPQMFDPHRLVCDDAGVFRRIDLEGFELPSDANQAVRDAADGAGWALHGLGYRGPFGTDAFLYTDLKGRTAIHPMCEINARLTFGHVAHAGR